ncbi:hypothetical protein ACI79G_17150 [Geodermatophilus sp. SYSU D00779]
MRDDELRARLTALADATAPPPRADLAAVVEHRHRARRRSQLRLGAVGAVVVAAVAVGRVLVPDGPSAEPATAVAEAPDVRDLPAPGDGPTRGSLAGDAESVEAVRQLSWSGPGARTAAPPPAGSQVLFAGDAAGGRWAPVSRPLTVPPPLVDDDELERRLGTGSVALAGSPVLRAPRRASCGCGARRSSPSPGCPPRWGTPPLGRRPSSRRPRPSPPGWSTGPARRWPSCPSTTGSRCGPSPRGPRRWRSWPRTARCRPRSSRCPAAVGEPVRTLVRAATVPAP